MAAETVTIIGAGPSGMAAANQLSLYGIEPVVFEPGEPGGLLLEAGSVVNYPGVPEGISGEDLVKLFPCPQRLVRERVTSLSREPGGKYIIEHTGGTVSAQAVLVASGTLPVKPDIPGVPPERVHHGVRSTRKAEFASAAVIGGGDAALDYALTLSKRAEVRVYARSGFKGASPHLLKQAGASGRIALFPEHGDFSSFSEDIVVVACGREPNLAFLSRELVCSPPGNGSYHLCGDCTSGIYRQASIAVAAGVRAAMAVRSFLEGNTGN
ncbi:MAG TPA: NAD(P)/FAD-dependent oxidoreductase [Candidatus Sabulitectum sp.]|nr:NAD(P)/FAD-dependent oxidoreductase [Candidatus Sabulitectum sp.]